MEKINHNHFSKSRDRVEHKYLHSKLYLAILLGINISTPLWSVQAIAESNINSQNKSYDFNLPKNDLASTLLLYSKQSDVQVIVASELVRGKTSTVVQGKYTAQKALKLLLSNTSLNIRFIQNNTAVISEKSNDGTRVLGAVKVEGNLDSNNISSTVGGVSSKNLSSITGVNGSRDLTATEGSKSYARGNVSIDGHSVRDAQKIAQSITTVNHQQLKDQKATNLKDALKNAAGINFIVGTNGNPIFYSRGYSIENYTVDGSPEFINSSGGSSAYGKIQSIDDISLYDHIEVLRGTDAFLNQGSNTNPGGSVNLVRKKPLDHKQVLTELTYGSWSNKRASIDITGPLTNDGRLKGRLIGTSVDKGEFWRNGFQEKNIVSGDLQYDVTPDTIASFGFDYGRVTSRPPLGGIVFGRTGEDLFLPRDYSMLLPWEKTSTLKKELRFSFDHNFNEDWSVHLKAKRNWATSKFLFTDPILAGFLNEEKKLYLQSYQGTASSNNYGVESSLLGKTSLWNLEQNIELSAQHFSNSTKSLTKSDFSQHSVQDIKDINYNDIPLPKFDNPVDRFETKYSYGGVYLKLDFQPFESFHILTGPRWGYSNSKSSNNSEKLDRFSIPYYALRYDWNKNWSTYASYTEIYEVQSQLKTVDDSILDPLTGSTRELGVKFSNDRKDLTASLALYDTRRNNISELIYNSAIPNCCFIIGDNTEQSRGIDFEIAGEITPYWQINLSYAFNKNYRLGGNNENGNPPLESRMPQHTFKLANTISGWGNPLLEKLKGGFSINYRSSGYRQDVAPVDPNDRNQGARNIQMTQGGHSVSDLFLAYEFNKNINAQLNINNVFDKRYYTNINGMHFGGRYGEPRNILFSLSAKF